MEELALNLSRVQFGISAGYHFIFPPTTLGLAFLILIAETLYLTTKKEEYRKVTNFAVRILTLVFALGVATGLLLPFMFGMNWGEFSKHAGALFGVQLAVEAVVAFTLESVFIGVLFFGRDKIKPFWYWFSALAVFIGSHLSGFIIIAANSWMQTPDGFHIDAAGKAIMDNWLAFNFNPSTMVRFTHVVTAAWMVGSFLLVGCAAYFYRKGRDIPIAKKMLGMAGVVAIITALAQPLIGHWHVLEVEEHQPAKSAAMEGMYKTQKGAPLYLFGWVDEKNQTVYGPSIPGGLSFFYNFDWNSTVHGLDEVPDQAKTVSKDGIEQQIPVNLVFQNFRIMVGCSAIALVIIMLTMIYYSRGTLERKKKSLLLVQYAPILTYIAVVTGWFTAEIGRQPWVIYPANGHPGLSTADAVTKNLDPAYVWFSIISYVLVYVICTIVFIRFLPKIVKKGLDPQPLEGEGHV